MPTIACKPQADGTFRGWSVLFPGSLALGFRAIDDSDGVTHDSAASYITLAKGARISFPFFLQWGGGIPSLVTVNLVAQRGGAAHPQMQIGFYRGATAAFDAVMFNPGAAWGLATRNFATDPFTGAAWDPDDMARTEVCVQNETGANGSNDVTLLSASVVYTGPHNFDPIFPPSARLG